MLRYFYILICIPLCFCYEYIENNQQFRNPSANSEIKKENDKRKVQFDVASFLRYTATEKTQDYEPYYEYKNKNRAVRTQSDYYESPINENIKKRNENTNYFNIDTDPDSNDNDPRPNEEDGFQPNPQFIGKIAKNKDNLVSNRENKAKNKHNKLLVDNDLILYPEKKCAFKNMKVPFFSHKSKPKKQKRKSLCFHCSKRYAKEPLKPEANKKIKQLGSKLGRAYGNLCPKCLKKLLKKQKKVPKKNKIHNSREFYQNIANQEHVQNDKGLNKFEETTSKSRLKRYETEDQERQLKELDEVERKVDNVKVTTPKFIIEPKNDNTLVDAGYSQRI